MIYYEPVELQKHVVDIIAEIQWTKGKYRALADWNPRFGRSKQCTPLWYNQLGTLLQQQKNSWDAVYHKFACVNTLTYIHNTHAQNLGCKVGSGLECTISSSYREVSKWEKGTHPKQLVLTSQNSNSPTIKTRCTSKVLQQLHNLIITTRIKVICSFVGFKAHICNAIQYDLLGLLQLLFIMYFMQFNQKVGLVQQYYKLGWYLDFHMNQLNTDGSKITMGSMKTTAP